MVHVDYLNRRPENATQILGWILMAICASFFLGMIVRGKMKLDGAIPLHSAPMENALPNADPLSGTGNAPLLW